MIVVYTFLRYNRLVDESEKEGNFYLILDEELIDNKYDSIRLRPRNSTAEKHPVFMLLIRMGGTGGVFVSISPQKSEKGKVVTKPYTKGGARYAK